jgi:probable F420-dependent oxidoreductase
MAAVVAEGEWIYGIQLPIQTLTRTLVDPWEVDATVADLVTVARRAEAAGNSFIGVCDHIAIPDNEYARQMSTTWFDTVATLSFLAAHTSTIRLLSIVWVAAYRHPLQTAKAFGTLDHISGGRAILGVGAGHVEAEFEALGIDFHTRGRRLDETIDAVRCAFDDTYVTHRGEFFSYSEMGVAPQPEAELPIWVGGMGSAAWKRAGRVGDGYIPMGNGRDQYPEIIETMHAAADAAGRADRRFDIGYHVPWCYLLGDPPEGLPPVLVSGIDALADDLRAARRVGINTFHLKMRARTLAEYLEQLDAFAEEVVPLVNES